MRDNILKAIAIVLLLSAAGGASSFAASAETPAVVTLPAPSAAEAAGDVTRLAQATPADVSPFIWSATKAADGSVAFDGYVPSSDVGDTLTDGIAKISANTTKVAGGAPDNFSTNAVAALDVLGSLDSGKIAFDGSNWSITGAVDNADKAKAAQAAFDGSPLKGAGTKYEVTAPAAAAAAPAAPAAPTAATVDANYAWSAEKAADGTITFTGTVPNDKLKGFLVTHANGKAVDNTKVATGAPDTFVGGALYGLNALMQLDSGKLAFAGGKWSLSGVAKDDAASKSAVGQLGVIDTKSWKFDIGTGATAAVPATPATPTPAKAAGPDYAFTAFKGADGTILLAGDVPTAGAKGYLGDIAGNAPTQSLVVLAGAPDNFITNVLGGLDALGKLQTGRLTLSQGKWSLSGRAEAPDVKDAVVASLGKLPAGKDFAADVTGPTPVELCQGKLTTVIAAGKGINFDGRSIKFVKGVDAELDGVAAALAVCPDARVDVEGNTDADGTANANMALSVARAEAVIDALVKRGLKADRLYAVGYGETLPLVPNTTKANKAKNRRIEFKLAPDAK